MPLSKKHRDIFLIKFDNLRSPNEKLVILHKIKEMAPRTVCRIRIYFEEKSGEAGMARRKKVDDLEPTEVLNIFKELEKVTRERSVSLGEGLRVAARNVLLRRKIRNALRKAKPKCTVKFRLKDGVE